MIPPRAAIFDIGRVIVRVAPGRAADALRLPKGDGAPPEAQAERIWTAIQADPLWPEWQCGRLTPQQWHEHLCRRLHVALSFAEFRAAWNRVLDPEPILAESLFAALGRRCRLALLSNTDPLHAEYLEQGYPLLHRFPVRIYSCCVGARKPDPAIFRKAFEALGVPASETLYVDDVPAFAEAARQLGCDAIHFESPRQLTGELVRRALLATPE